jgi:hypothetical protein
MVKRKSKAQVLVPDGAGGTTPVPDRRFETDDWPIKLVVGEDRAPDWLVYLADECSGRGWSLSSIGQIEAKENSGSMSITKGAAERDVLAIVWEKQRHRALNVKAKPAGEHPFSLEEARAFIDRVDERSRTESKREFYTQGQLHYHGHAWRGDLWLSDDLCLGAPSVTDERSLFGPRVVLAHMRTAAVNQQHAYSLLPVQLRQLSVFLTIVMRKAVSSSTQSAREWTTDLGADGTIKCDVRQIGYVEQTNVGMPTKGQGPQAVPSVVQRPDLSSLGNSIALSEQPIPSDSADLWRTFGELDAEHRQKFLQAGNLYQLSLSLGREHETTSFVFLVCACEALKPSSSEFRDTNSYDVIKGTLGIGKVDLLRAIGLEPDTVRHGHLHLGELRGSEFHARTMHDSYVDPTFLQAHSEYARLTPAVFIDWLMRRGNVPLPPSKRRRREWTWIEHHARVAVSVAFVIGFAVASLAIAVLHLDRAIH